MMLTRRSRVRTPLIGTMQRLGLTGGLRVCLDAGDAASAPASPTKWLDTSGAGADFFLGTDATATAADPTFTGTVGQLSAGEYFACDGGDHFRYDTTNEAWMDSAHKAAGKFSAAAWVWFGAVGAIQPICGTNNDASANTGFAFRITATNRLQWNVRNGSGVALLFETSALIAISASRWHFCAMAVDEAVGANGGLLMLDGAFSTHASTATSPSASAATFPMEIGSAGNGGNRLSNGSRIAMFAAWDQAIGADALAALYDATRARFGV